MQKGYSPRRRRPRPQHKTPEIKIRPGADSRLKRVFARIGVPEKVPFAPDPFQTEAVAAVARADCLVTAPTGSGKTWIAEQAIQKIFAGGGRAWYACPLKALSNAKFAEFAEHFGAANVGILTGDRREQPEAPIIIGTTEILRNQLYDAMHTGTEMETDFVVLDEAHFLGDYDRGVVWEEIMIYLPARIPLLLLSATIGNAREIADWLSAIRKKKCRVVQETCRTVPLYPLFFAPSGTLMALVVPTGPKARLKLYQKVNDLFRHKRKPSLGPPWGLPPFGDTLQVLHRYNLLPAIFFLKSRADCGNALKLCLANRIDDPERQESLRARIDELLTATPHLRHHRQLWHLEHLAVGAHHSGQLPIWKLLLETLMSEGLLDAVFATSTVAAGVNFPARTILFLNSDRFNGQEFAPLTATEYHQMTGRAGRRGKDNIGFAIAVPGRFMDVHHTARLISAPPSDVTSQIRINFSMALNLLLSHTPEQVEDLLKRSFATFQLIRSLGPRASRRALAQCHHHLRDDFRHHLAFLHTHGFVDAGGRLTTDGEWTAQLRVDQPLLIAEGFRLGAFPREDPALMAGIVAAFVNENEPDDHIHKDWLPRRLTSAYNQVRRQLAPFARSLHTENFPVRPLFRRPAVTLYHWARGMPWDKLVRLAELEEGNLAMLILRTADNLRHIRSLSAVFPEAAQAAGEAVDAILKDPVITEL
ncbi:MAG: DEAD/DEAH box helicase [Desulfosarcina sp.]|nr:DEAD/DEAH box helicase [Desulfobacterales bacterium]